MLYMHILARSIRIKTTLPHRWSNVTFNVVKYSSDSDSSSGSDSDLDSKLEVPNNKKIVERTNVEESGRLNYLQDADKRRAQHENNKLAQKLKEVVTSTSTILQGPIKPEDKDQIFLKVLDIISEHNDSSSSKSDKTEVTNKLEDELSEIKERKQKLDDALTEFRELLNKQQTTSYMENPLPITKIQKKEQQRKIVVENWSQEQEVGPSIIKTLLSKQQRKDSTKNRSQQERQQEMGPSIARTLLSEQQGKDDTKNRSQAEQQREMGPSIIETLLSKQQKRDDTKNRSQGEQQREMGPSIIETLLSKQQKRDDTTNRSQGEQQREMGPSIIETLLSKQQKRDDTTNRSQGEQQREMGPSIIETLLSKQQEKDDTKNRSQAEQQREMGPSIIETLLSKQQEENDTKNRSQAEQQREMGPSIIETLLSKQQKKDDTKNRSQRKQQRERDPSIIRTLLNEQQEENITEQNGSEFLNQEIFTDEYTESSNTPELTTWDKCYKNQLKYSAYHIPKNLFDEMIKWTEDGKLWRFPINNEQGMDEEQNVHFSKHVFLEEHLKGWCPTKGPIRHYMELVCVGLSKNPYLTVKEKTDHILWYKQYFSEKQDLLKKLGILE